MSSFKITLALLTGVTLFMLIFIAQKFYSSKLMPQPENSAITIPLQTAVEQETAFVKLKNYTSRASRNQSWKATIETNTWAKCSVTLFDPQRAIYGLITSPEPTFIEPGKYYWEHLFLPSAPIGTWTVRFACGNPSNLASTDIQLEVE